MPPPDATQILDRISASMEAEPSAPLDVRASCGMARAPEDGWQATELVDAADRRLNDHKRQRSGQHVAIGLAGKR